MTLCPRILVQTEGEACRCTFLASFKDEMVLFRHEGKVLDDAADLDSSGVPVLITLPTAGDILDMMPTAPVTV